MQRQIGDDAQGILIPQKEQAAGDTAFGGDGDAGSGAAQNAIHAGGALQRVEGGKAADGAVGGGVGDGIAAGVRKGQQGGYHIRADFIIAPAGVQVAGAIVPQGGIGEVVLGIGVVIQRRGQRPVQQVAGQLGGAGVGAVEQAAAAVLLQQWIAVLHLAAEGGEGGNGISQPAFLVEQQGGLREEVTADGAGAGQQQHIGFGRAAVILQGGQIFFSQRFIGYRQVFNEPLAGEVDAVRFLHAAQHQQGGFPLLQGVPQGQVLPQGGFGFGTDAPLGGGEIGEIVTGEGEAAQQSAEQQHDIDEGDDPVALHGGPPFRAPRGTGAGWCGAVWLGGLCRGRGRSPAPPQAGPADGVRRGGGAAGLRPGGCGLQKRGEGRRPPAAAGGGQAGGARFGDAEHRRACGPTPPRAAAWGYYSRKASEVASRMRFHTKVTAWERPGQRRVKRAIRGVAAPLHR